MDQLRKALTWLKQQHFWVLSVLIVLIGLFCWWKAAGTMSAEYDKNQKQITAEFASLANLSNDPFHPNQRTIDSQTAEIKKQAEQVAAMWQQLYDVQRENVLKWPDALPKQFRDQVENLQFGADIDPILREQYQNYVWRHFPNLPKKIGARPLPENATDSRGGGRGAYALDGPGLTSGQPAVDDGDYICVWSDLDQAAVRNELEFGQQPSALLIWVTQENMWVYDTLLSAIKNTNEAAGATRVSNAAIKTIYSLEVGQRAARYARKKDRIYKAPKASTPGGEELLAEAPIEQAEMPEQPMDFDRQDGMMLTKEQESARLLRYRYLGEDGKPFAPGGGGGGEEGAVAAIDPATIGVEYKQLPVRMVLEMDKRYLNTFIAELASQPLQVEVQEVRMNTPDAGPTDNNRGGMGAGPGGSIFPDRGGILQFPAQPNVGNVIIQGVIYIFKPPNQEVLQVEAEPLASN